MDVSQQISPNQFRVMAAGFVFPVVMGGLGIAVPLHAVLSPSLDYIAYAASLPWLGLTASLQWQVWRATKSEGSQRGAAFRRVHAMLLIPFLIVGMGIVLTGGALLTGLGGRLPRLASAMLIVALVFCFLGACFLPLTVRARQIVRAAA